MDSRDNSNGLLANTNTRLAALEAKGAERTIELAAAKDECRRLKAELDECARLIAMHDEAAADVGREFAALREQLAAVQAELAAWQRATHEPTPVALGQYIADLIIEQVELKSQLAAVTKERDMWRPTDNELERFFDPREKCRCGSGAHPRKCPRHKTALAEHVNALNLGMLTGFDGLDDMEACDAAEKSIHELGVARVKAESELRALRERMEALAAEMEEDARGCDRSAANIQNFCTREWLRGSAHAHWTRAGLIRSALAASTQSPADPTQPDDLDRALRDNPHGSWDPEAGAWRESAQPPAETPLGHDQHGAWCDANPCFQCRSNVAAPTEGSALELLREAYKGLSWRRHGQLYLRIRDYLAQPPAPTGGPDVARARAEAFRECARDADEAALECGDEDPIDQARAGALWDAARRYDNAADAALAQPPAPTSTPLPGDAENEARRRRHATFGASGTPQAARDESDEWRPRDPGECQHGVWDIFPGQRNELRCHYCNAPKSAALPAPSIPPLPAGWSATNMAKGRLPPSWDYDSEGFWMLSIYDDGDVGVSDQCHISIAELLAVLQHHIARQGSAT